jgi:hypothetical protein
MKLSEAILLGSTVVGAKAGRQYSPGTEEGCALGMAAIATGCRYGPYQQRVEERDRRTLGAEAVWGNWVLNEIEPPCICEANGVPRKMRIKDIIAHLFDHHIFGNQDWTMEKLATWVQTVEPKNVEPRIGRQNVDVEEIFRRKRLMEDEIREWQTVREAFAARHESRLRRDRHRV